MLDFYVKTGIRFSLRGKRLFEITEVEITRVDCTRKPLWSPLKDLNMSTVSWEQSAQDRAMWPFNEIWGLIESVSEGFLPTLGLIRKGAGEYEDKGIMEA